MGMVAEKLPLIDLPIGLHKRGLGVLEVELNGAKKMLPLAGVDVSAKVANCVATVVVKQKFRNTLTEHLAATYTFPLAGGCVVSDFEMLIGDRIVKGIVKERAEAQRQYQQALNEGKRAALLEQERDDVFTMQVGNIVPGEDILVTLTYSERLTIFNEGETELALPLVVAPRYIRGETISSNPVGTGVESDTNVVPDASRISPPRLADGLDPDISLSIAVQIETKDSSGKNAISDLRCSQHATNLGFSDGAIKVELARSDERLNRDFVLRWKLAGDRLKPSLLVYNHPNGERYGMLSLIAPKKSVEVSVARDVLFILDRSGSMNGLKMTSAVKACSILMRSLTPADRFAVQIFDNQVDWFDRHGDRFIHADEAGLEKGEDFLRGVRARGGTEIERAMLAGFNEIANQKESGRAPIIVLLTDGQTGSEAQALKLIQSNIANTRLFTVGIDTAVNSGLLKRAAQIGGGTCSVVQPGVNLEEALAAVAREIGVPLVTDLSVNNFATSEEKTTLMPRRIPDLFDGRAVTAFMKLGDTNELSIKGKWSDGGKLAASVSAVNVDVPAIAQLWAKAAITELEDEFRINRNDTLKKRIIDLSVAHSVLTKLTAYVAVDSEVVNKAGVRREIVQPVEQPALWEMNDVGLGGAVFGSAPMMHRASAKFGSAANFDAETTSNCLASFGSSADLSGSAPLPPPGASSLPPAAPAQSPPARSAGGVPGANVNWVQNAWSKLTGHAKPSSQSLLQALNEFAQTLSKFAKALGGAGGHLNFLELDQTRLAVIALINGLGASKPAMVEMKRFLETSATDLVASVQASSMDVDARRELWTRHVAEFERLANDLRAELGGGSAPF